MPGDEFTFTSQELFAAEAVIETLRPELFANLMQLQSTAYNAFVNDKSKSRVEAANFCYIAGEAWLRIISDLSDDSRTKLILMVGRALNLLQLGATHLHKEITDPTKAPDLKLIIQYLILQGYIYAGNQQIDRSNSTVVEMIDTIEKTLREKSSLETSYNVFSEVHQFTLTDNFPAEIVQIFQQRKNNAKNNALEHAFYNLNPPSREIMLEYRGVVCAALDAGLAEYHALTKPDTGAEKSLQKLKDAMTKMEQREAELQKQGYATPSSPPMLTTFDAVRRSDSSSSSSSVEHLTPQPGGLRKRTPTV